MKIIKAIALYLIIINFFVQGSFLYAAKSSPDYIDVGLNYNNPLFYNINIKSNKPVELAFKTKDKNMSLPAFPAIDYSFRKDSYYNIINNETKAIQFVKAVKYSGILIGPYHVQIGDTYDSYDAARNTLSTYKKLIKDAYIVYEDGWKLWCGLLLDQNECKALIEKLQNTLPNTKHKTIEPDINRVQIIDQSTGEIVLVCNSDEIEVLQCNEEGSGLLEYNGSRYRGDIILKVQNDGSFGVINHLPLEYYLYGVVPSEMYPLWPIEALKAQAVAARNFAMLNLNKHIKDGYGLCNTQHCQVYKGFDNEHECTNEAVDKTKGKLLYYKEELAQTYYHSSSGGHTENSENVWSEAVPYIRGVKDTYGLGSPNDEWLCSLDKAFIESKLSANNYNIGELLDIKALDISEFGRVTKLEFKGRSSTAIFEKERIRTILGTANIKSTWYEIKTESDINVFQLEENNSIVKRPEGLQLISADSRKTIKSQDKNIYIKGLFETKKYSILPSEYIFSGKGWGHGLGLSQYGAKGMAEEGYNYTEILEYYFKGTKVK